MPLSQSHLKRHLLLILAVFLLFPLASLAQDTLSLDAYNLDKAQLTRGGMLVLGSWAVGNIGFSGVQYFRTTGDRKYFHQMNVFWNFVNLGLAVPGYLGANPDNVTGLSFAETLKGQQGIEKMLLVNAGLDVGYIMTGFFLREKSKTASKRNDLFKGYGNSLLMQGGFLLVFDSVFYLVQRSHAANDLWPFLEKISVGPGTIGLNMTF